MSVPEVFEAMWTAEQVAAFLAVPVATIYAWRYRRVGPPAFRVGRYLRYRRADVEAWLDEQRAWKGRVS